MKIPYKVILKVGIWLITPIALTGTYYGGKYIYSLSAKKGIKNNIPEIKDDDLEQFQKNFFALNPIKQNKLMSLLKSNDVIGIDVFKEEYGESMGLLINRILPNKVLKGK